MEALVAQLPVLLLVSNRIAGIVMVSPVFANPFFPPQARAGLTLLLGLLILPAVRVAPVALQPTALIAACALELLVGLVIGFLSQMVFASVQMAGTILDLDMGFSMAQVLDPVTNRSEPIIGSFFQTLAVMIYLTVNAHHWLLRAIAESYLAVPAGTLSLTGTAPMHVALFFGTMFASAVKMVLPFMAVMLLLSAALAATNRAVQQMNIFAVGMGAKAVLGFLMLALILPYVPAFLESLFSVGHQELLRTLELMK